MHYPLPHTDLLCSHLEKITVVSLHYLIHLSQGIHCHFTVLSSLIKCTLCGEHMVYASHLRSISLLNCPYIDLQKLYYYQTSKV